MPWCDSCQRYLTPTSLDADGTCPSCDTVVAERAAADPDRSAEQATATRAPWHFKLLVLAVVLYLGWRAVEGIAWVLGLG
jgi:hypothetical protein